MKQTDKCLICKERYPDPFHKCKSHSQKIPSQTETSVGSVRASGEQLAPCISVGNSSVTKPSSSVPYTSVSRENEPVNEGLNPEYAKSSDNQNKYKTLSRLNKENPYLVGNLWISKEDHENEVQQLKDELELKLRKCKYLTTFGYCRKRNMKDCIKIKKCKFK